MRRRGHSSGHASSEYRSSLHSPGSNASNDSPLKHQDEHYQRDRHGYRRSGHVTPWDKEETGEVRDPDRNGLAIWGRRERQREHELLPVEHEGNESRRYYPGKGQWRDHTPNNAKHTCSVNLGSLLHFLRYSTEVAIHDEDHQRQGESDVGCG